jgi:hypothetical protein
MSRYRIVLASLLAAGLLVSLNASVVSAEDVIVSTRTASPGDTVQVAITAGPEGFSAVGSSSFELSYDTTYLDAVLVNNGGSLSSFMSHVNEGAGRVKAGSISLTGDNIPGDTIIFEVTFEVDSAASKGKIPLRIQAALTDAELPEPNPIPAGTVDGKIIVKRHKKGR